MENKIVIGKGLGRIQFGLDRDDVIELLGTPTEKELEKDEFGESESWHFDHLDLSLLFDGNNYWQLVSISVTSDAYSFCGIHPIGMDKDDFIKHMHTLDMEVESLEFMKSEGETFQELLSMEEEALDIWVDNGIISELQWGGVYDEEDSMDW
jgi:hypothetical protein